VINLVTFDAAGTLIDHCWDPGGIAADAARCAGHMFDREESRRVHRTVAESYRAEQEELERIGNRGAIRAMWQRQMADWLKEMGGAPERAPEVLTRFEELAFGPGSHVFMLFEDVRPTIESIRALGIPMGVISNWDHTLFGVLEGLKVDAEFELILASLVFGTEKPDKRIFLKACEQGNVSPEHTLHVGDSVIDDFDGARDAGLHSLLIDRDREPSLAEGRISTLMQVPEVMRCMN
jgi:HAD superfamily hydrolase (TIGR01549 family)